ncbi:MAG: hypothetical protein OEV64_00960 [Desulfobulbaceae bacterium]|nr:hypothetical protein [Desulfobulbaceae bacterium]
MVGRELTKLKAQYPYIEIQEVDVIAHPMQTIKNNIKMIPALKIGNKSKIIGFNPDTVREFVEANLGTPTL